MSEVGDGHDDRDEEPDNSDNSSGSEDESIDSSSDEGSGLLDLVAIEAHEALHEGSSTDNELDDSSLHSPWACFNPFCRLPYELRQRIWELFCPELRFKPRVLDFTISPGTARHRDSTTPSAARIWTVHDGLTLQDQTSNTRTILSVHQESRAMALRALPHTLSIDGGSGDAEIRFNRDADVILINGLRGANSDDIFHLPKFADEVKNVALGGWESSDRTSAEAFSNLVGNFGNLQSLFTCASSAAWRKKNLIWCTSDLANRFFSETFESEPGIGEDLEILYAWPDVYDHKDFAKFQIPHDECQTIPEVLQKTLDETGAQAWPMAIFEFDRGMRRYRSLLDCDPGADDHYSSDDNSQITRSTEESHTDLDAYESDGIDDDEIIEIHSSSDEEDEVTLEHAFPRSAALLDHESHNTTGDEASEGNFSSPEAASEAGEDTTVSSRRRKRQIVSDSDDETEAQDRPVSKRARVARIVLSDSEGESEPDGAREADHIVRRPRVLISDSEETLSGDDLPVAKEAGSAGIKYGVVSEPGARNDSDGEESESAESDDSEDSGEDLEQPVAHVSLAERLHLHREVPAVPSSESGTDDHGSEDSSTQIAGDEDESDEGASRNGLVLDLAEESGGSDEY
ncbi:hypothetical protein G7046_g1993 [Stylonectria norvegica]|nr:hypothetical protein G7046_g1993 [Stylonectria norvegica]